MTWSEMSYNRQFSNDIEEEQQRFVEKQSLNDKYHRRLAKRQEMERRRMERLQQQDKGE